MLDFLIVSGGIILWLAWLAWYAWIGQGWLDVTKRRPDRFYEDTH